MNHELVRPSQNFVLESNESRTSILLESSLGSSGNKLSSSFSLEPTNQCGYVRFEQSEERGRDRFCNAPAAIGSSYCEHHRARCTASPKSAAGRAIAAALRWQAEHAPEPPSELTHLGAVAFPESALPEEPRDLVALLDHPPRAAVPESE